MKKLLEYKVEEDRIIIFGDTFSNKEKIKNIGASYDGRAKAWSLKATGENIKLVERLCQSCNKKVDINQVFTDRLNSTFPQFSKIIETRSFQSEKTKEDLLSSESLNQTFKEQPKSSLGMSIFELLTSVERTVKQIYEYPVWVLGEVQNISFSKSGIFFELVEPSKYSSGVLAVKSCIWNQDIEAIAQRSKIDITQFLKDGLKLRVCARVGFYKARSYINLEIKDIDPSYTKGDLALKRQELVNKLKKEGLYYKNKQLPFVRFPLKIGLISSYKSRAYSDFLDQLHIGRYPGKVIFFDARVQGQDCIQDIIKGIQTLCESGVDLITVVRGGGSLSDLMWFDSESIVYAIAQSQVPVLSAIGHHDDQSVSEEVSFRREKTPTAAADFILSVIKESKDLVDDLTIRIQEMFLALYERKVQNLYDKRQALEQAFSVYISGCKLQIKSKESSLIQGGMSVFFKLDSKIQKMMYLLEQAWMIFTTRQEGTLDRFLFKLEKIDPRLWLNQGYTRLKKCDEVKNLNIKSVCEVVLGESLQAELVDGSLKLKVEDIKKC